MASVVRLVVTRGEHQGKEFPLEEGSNLIGRWDPEAASFPEIDLEGDDPESKISRKHAVIFRNANTLTVEDVGSLNGTFINRGPRLEPGTKYELKAGDEVIVGKTFLRLELAE